MENMKIAKKTSPIIKKSKEAIVREGKEKNSRMIRCQLKMYGVKGLKDLQLTYLQDSGVMLKKLAQNNQILELPFGYIKYLNEHGKVRVERRTAMRLLDDEGNPKRVITEDAEQRYSLKILDVLSSADFEELDPTIILKSRLA